MISINTYTWNPWHGCKKISEGCQNCYMYYLDNQRGKDGSNIYRVKNSFNLPIQKDKTGEYKIKSGSHIKVCMTSDFFLKEADSWREEAWNLIRKRKDVLFILLTKRTNRVLDCLPPDWGDGWNNVWLDVTVENQKRANQRLPILINLPFKYKGIVVAPLLEDINLEEYLKLGDIDSVSVAGENYSDCRICDFNWVKSIGTQCMKHNVSFDFFETGMKFLKDGKLYNVPKDIQKEQAIKSGVNFKGKEVDIKLLDINKFEQIALF